MSRPRPTDRGRLSFTSQQPAQQGRLTVPGRLSSSYWAIRSDHATTVQKPQWMRAWLLLDEPDLDITAEVTAASVASDNGNAAEQNVTIFADTSTTDAQLRCGLQLVYASNVLRAIYGQPAGPDVASGNWGPAPVPPFTVRVRLDPVDHKIYGWLDGVALNGGVGFGPVPAIYWDSTVIGIVDSGFGQWASFATTDDAVSDTFTRDDQAGLGVTETGSLTWRYSPPG